MKAEKVKKDERVEVLRELNEMTDHDQLMVQ